LFGSAAAGTEREYSRIKHCRKISGTFKNLLLYNAGKRKFTAAAPIFMQRNLDRRVEVAFPIKDDELKEFLKKYDSSNMS